ncbi:PGN_0703 family putative restriction endonuclease [Methylobacterium sp. sgz302541]|uniref:PGN_0703 family putative restriction endonuclease n=1 Tax=unclassified Methylobacterium TaxID=2615210 RepID=UPI003D34E0FC
MPLSHAPTIPDATRRAHAAFLASDDAFSGAARLLASLWRAERGLPCSVQVEPGSAAASRKPRRVRAGWRLRPDAARAGRTFLTPEIAAYVRRALILREPGALWDEPKILGHLLASQGLALNLCAVMALDLDLASRVWSDLLPDFVHRVTHVRFETSPGRGHDDLLQDHTAFDIQLDVVTPDADPAFVAVELKFIEPMAGPSASVRARYGEVARACGLYRSPDDLLLYRPGIEQLRREHTLGQLMVDHGYASRGLFVLAGPALNRRVGAAAQVYADALVAPRGATPDRVGFVHLTIEAILAALARSGAEVHARAVHARYLDFERVTAVALGDIPPPPTPPRVPTTPLALPSPCPSAASPSDVLRPPKPLTPRRIGRHAGDRPEQAETPRSSVGGKPQRSPRSAPSAAPAPTHRATRKACRTAVSGGGQ